ncbi:Encodes a protein whose expression is responsive to nematode infection [Abeliophyllum distichum]|uniref:Encodes a protein whose expression is responsive to nematode infection n=1 Tax=Abeliophyllum distichum TaxID=126358 RepID=A0ABD1U288_9LAMI
MGNSLGGKKTAKVMKIDGQTIKFKTPVSAGEVVKDHPGYVLLESEAVQHYGIRAKPLEPQQELKPKRLYFLVELPKFPQDKNPRRVRSGIQMSAKDRLESLMLSRRSISDLSIMKPPSIAVQEAAVEEDQVQDKSQKSGAVRLRLKLPKAELEKLVMESNNGAEVAEKIASLYMANSATAASAAKVVGTTEPNNVQHVHWKADHGNIMKRGLKSREKRVGFLPIREGEIQLAVAS